MSEIWFSSFKEAPNIRVSDTRDFAPTPIRAKATYHKLCDERGITPDAYLLVEINEALRTDTPILTKLFSGFFHAPADNQPIYEEEYSHVILNETGDLNWILQPGADDLRIIINLPTEHRILVDPRKVPGIIHHYHLGEAVDYDWLTYLVDASSPVVNKVSEYHRSGELHGKVTVSTPDTDHDLVSLLALSGELVGVTRHWTWETLTRNIPSNARDLLIKSTDNFTDLEILHADYRIKFRK